MAKFSKCSCEHCGTHIEFPVEAAGATVACPYCEGQTTLRTAQPPPNRAANNPTKGGRKVGRLVAITAIILVAGSLGGWAALKKFSATKAPGRTESSERSSAPKELVASAKESVSDNPFVRLEGTVVSSSDIKKGRDVYMGKCAKCHQFFDPAAYNDFDWNNWMGKMRGEARLNGEQAELLNRFLVTIRHP